MKKSVLLKLIASGLMGALLFCTQLCEAEMMEYFNKNENGEVVRGITIEGSFGPAEEAELRTRLQDHTVANELYINYIRSSEELIRILNVIMQNSDTVSGLSFAINHIDANAAGVLANLLAVNRTITGLTFTSNRIEPENLQRILLAIRSSSAIKRLSSFQSFDAGLIIAMLLRNSGTVSQLAVDSLSDDGVAVIADSLRVNQSVNSVALYGTIEDDGTASIAAMLQTNRSVVRLDLSCIIGLDNVLAIAGAIAANPVMTEIRLGSYEVDAASINSILLVLANSMTLRQISVPLNGEVSQLYYNEAPLQIIDLIVERNRLIAQCMVKIMELNRQITADGGIVPIVSTQLVERQGTTASITAADIVNGSNEQLARLPTEVLTEISEIRHHQLQILDLLHGSMHYTVPNNS